MMPRWMKKFLRKSITWPLLVVPSQPPQPTAVLTCKWCFRILALLLACLAILAWLAHSKFGLFVRALREDQDAAAALGVNTTRYKVLVFTITCAMAAAAGAVQGHYVQIITPNMLFLLQMSLVVAMERRFDVHQLTERNPLI